MKYFCELYLCFIGNMVFFLRDLQVKISIGPACQFTKSLKADGVGESGRENQGPPT